MGGPSLMSPLPLELKIIFEVCASFKANRQVIDCLSMDFH